LWAASPQDEHKHALLHGQAVSSSSIEKHGDKDSDAGDATPEHTGDWTVTVGTII
jgi:hypothetical protein